MAEKKTYLQSIVFDDPSSPFFAIRFLVLSFDESYLVSPVGNGIKKLEISLYSLGFEEKNMKFIPDINPLLNNHSELHSYDHSFPLRGKAPKGMKHRCL